MRLLLAILAVGLMANYASAQVTRGTVAGRVADKSGAVIPHASITITNTSTGAKSQTVSGGDGFFTIPDLDSGPYTLSVTATGFKTYNVAGIVLHAQQHVTENVTLQVGSVNQTVHVLAENTLLDTQTATAGQVLTTGEVEALPSNGRSPIGFVRDEYGVVPKEKHLLTTVRPFDNSGGSDFSMGGGNSQSNEILLNGVPNMQDQTRVSAFSPILDAVSEIVADSFESSAVFGDTSNGIVNITTKSGTNQFHGTLSEYNETSALAARQYFQRPGQSVPATRQNQYGLTIGGPVILPKIFNGRNKLFFFYAYEGFTDSAPSATITTVPTDAERQGNFSALLPLGCANGSYNPSNPAVCIGGGANQYQLYNPYDATLTNGHVVRQPYADNIIGPLSPVGQAVMKYYPEANRAGAADGENNYFSNFPNTDKYFSNMGRIDYNVNTQNKLFFGLHQSSVTSESNDTFNNIATGRISNTNFWGGTFDDVEAFSPTLSLDNRVGYTRSYILATVPGAGFDPTQLGFPSYVNKASNSFVFPTFSPSGLPSLSYKAPSVNAFTTIQYFAELTKVWGRHTLEIGPDIRVSKKGGFSPDYSSGRYYFESSWVNAGTGAPSPKFGSGPAELLLGLSDDPSDGGFDVNSPTITSNFYFAGYIQDYWHVHRNLTIDLGLRLEHETAPVESRNRINVGFDPNAVNNVTQPAEAAYAVNPIPQLPTAQFKPTGGLTFATNSHRSPYSTEAAYWSPRLGFAWAPDAFHGGTVFRAGFGIFYNPLGVSACCNTAGFSETNLMVPTTDGYLTPAATLSNPYPVDSNPILQPTGASQGVNTLLGQSVSFATPNAKTTRSYRWNVDIQQRLAKGMMFELGYIGNRQSDLTITNQLAALPLQYLSHSPTRDAIVTSELSKNVPSPYTGLGAQYGSQISVARLLTPFSEFSGVSQQYDPIGYANYNALMARVTKQMSDGLQFNANFEWSRQLEASSQLNPGGPLWYGETASDFPIHFVITGLYDLPFGRGRRFGGSVNHAVDALIGGWALSSIYTWNSGAELSWGNSVINWGMPLNPQPRNLSQAFNVDAFDRNSADQPNSYNYRTFPSLMLRSDATNNVDLSAFKTFNFGESRNLQYRLDAFNAFNRPQFAAPNTSPTSSAFGEITGQANTARVIQMGLRFAF